MEQMNRLETLNIVAIRRELSDVCKKMIQIARGHGRGFEFYDTDHPDYKRLMPVRDRLANLLRREWNGY